MCSGIRFFVVMRVTDGVAAMFMLSHSVHSVGRRFLLYCCLFVVIIKPSCSRLGIHNVSCTVSVKHAFLIYERIYFTPLKGSNGSQRSHVGTEIMRPCMIEFPRAHYYHVMKFTSMVVQ